MEKVALYLVTGLLAGILIGAFIFYSIGMPYMYRMSMGYGDGQYAPMGSGGYSDGRYYSPKYYQGPGSFESNGERIYYTGINENGERIPFTGGPFWLVNYGGSCVNCHGRDGTGGFVPMMCNEKAPDIRYSTLTSGEHEHAYDVEAIKTAIVKGIEPDGGELNWCMPRWQMNEKDLNDIVEYLKTLD